MSIRSVALRPHVHARRMPPQTGVGQQPEMRGVSRRDFLQRAVGVTAIAGAAGAGLLRPQFAGATGPGVGDVVPISGGSSAIEAGFGQLFHVYGPPGADSPDSDPASVGNLSGNVGLAYINGTVTETNRKTGAGRELPFIDADMRFMQGTFRGRDGHERDGTFAFI